MTTAAQQQQHAKLKINPSSLSFNDANSQPQQLHATDEHDNELTSGVHYSSENATIASVNEHGQVTPHGKGNVNIVAVREASPEAKQNVSVSVHN